MPISIDMWDFWFKISIHDIYNVNEEYRIHIDHECIHSEILNSLICVFKVNIMLISIIMQIRGKYANHLNNLWTIFFLISLRISV